MATYMIEHLKTNPGYKPGTIIKAGTKVADAGLTGKLSASGHLMHICKASENGQKINDFNRGGNASYVGCTIQDPSDIVSKFKNSVYGTWNGNDGYKQSDGDFYVAPKVHLGGDYKFNSGTAITFKSDIKVIECGSASSHPDFGNCISFEFVSSSTQYYVNLDQTAGKVGCYESPGGKKEGDINPGSLGGLTYTNIGNTTNDSQEYKMAKIKTDSFGECWVTCEHYEGRSRSTTKKYEVVN